MGRDIGWLAVGLATLLGLAIAAALADARASSAITQGVLYVAVVVAVYLDHTDPNLPQLFEFAKLVLFPVLALAVAIRLRLSRERRFEVTPLDLLVIFVALALPNLPGLQRCAEQPRAERGQAGGAVLRARDAVESLGADARVAVARGVGVSGGAGGAGVGRGVDRESWLDR